MKIGRFLVEVLMASCLTLLLASLSQAAQISNGGRQPIYIEPLKAELAQDSASGDARASHRAEKVKKNASALTEALIRELNNRGVTAYPLGEQDPTPHAGWVIRGVFTEQVAKGLVFAGLRSLGSSTPNTEVDVSISNLGGDSGKPPRLINTAASLGGQGSVLSLNPYEAAAKVVVHHVASDRSIDDLARRIADQILAQPA